MDGMDGRQGMHLACLFWLAAAVVALIHIVRLGHDEASARVH